MVATSPSCFTHSCDGAYFNPSKTVEKHFEAAKADGQSEVCFKVEDEENLSALAIEEEKQILVKKDQMRTQMDGQGSEGSGDIRDTKLNWDGV